MDFQCLEVLLGLPAFRVIHQVLSPQQLELHLERRDSHIVCPHCGTCCSRVKESRPRCIRDLPSLERPVMLWLHLRRFAEPRSAGSAPGKRVQPSESGRSGRSASPSRYARNACGGVRATNWPVAMVSPHAPCFAGPLRGAVVAVRASSAEPLGSMSMPGVRGTATIR